MPDTTPPASVRIKRGMREIEVAGSEDFVRDLLEELIEEHIRSAEDHAVGPTDVGATFGVATGALPTQIQSFRDMLNAAPDATVAEKVIMAGYFLFTRSGAESFDGAALGELFDSAYEKQPNFSREFEKAARAGWLMRATVEGKRGQFKLTHRGMQRSSELMEVGVQ